MVGRRCGKSSKVSTSGDHATARSTSSTTPAPAKSEAPPPNEPTSEPVQRPSSWKVTAAVTERYVRAIDPHEGGTMSGYTVIDFETTGLAPALHDRVVEIGVVYVSDQGEIEGSGRSWSIPSVTSDPPTSMG